MHRARMEVGTKSALVLYFIQSPREKVCRTEKEVVESDL